MQVFSLSGGSLGKGCQKQEKMTRSGDITCMSTASYLLRRNYHEFILSTRHYCRFDIESTKFVIVMLWLL